MIVRVNVRGKLAANIIACQPHKSHVYFFKAKRVIEFERTGNKSPDSSVVLVLPVQESKPTTNVDFNLAYQISQQNCRSL